MKKYILFFFYLPLLFALPSESSYPYISGYTWWHFCDWKLTHPDFGKKTFSRFNPEDVRAGDTIFVEFDCLEEFAREFLPRLQNKVILVTANYGYRADSPLPGPYAYLQYSDKIIAWFVQNIDQAPTEKLIPMPIGLASNYWPHGDQRLLDVEIPLALEKRERDHFIYLNFSQSPERAPCTAHFEAMGVERRARKTYEAYLKDLADSVFVVSPPGGGIDCHRTWEALLMGAYPIVLSTTLDPLFADLPVVIVKNWEEVSFEFLQKEKQRLDAKSWPREKLYSPYWFDRIAALQEKVQREIPNAVQKKIEQHAASNSWQNSYYDVLLDVIDEHGYQNILEVGVALGGHAASLLNGTDIQTYIGVDPYRSYNPQDGFQRDVGNYSLEGIHANFDYLYAWVSGVRLQPFEERCRLIRKSSVDAALGFADESLDCIFIDGDHRYEEVLKDLNAWFPKLKTGHLITGDDYWMPSVARAVDEFFSLRRKEVFFFTSRSGYRVWAVYK